MKVKVGGKKVVFPRTMGRGLSRNKVRNKINKQSSNKYMTFKLIIFSSQRNQNETVQVPPEFANRLDWMLFSPGLLFGDISCMI